MIYKRTDARLASSLQSFSLCGFKIMAESFENHDNISRDWAIDKIQEESWQGIRAPFFRDRVSVVAHGPRNDYPHISLMIS